MATIGLLEPDDGIRSFYKTLLRDFGYDLVEFCQFCDFLEKNVNKSLDVAVFDFSIIKSDQILLEAQLSKSSKVVWTTVFNPTIDEHKFIQRYGGRVVSKYASPLTFIRCVQSLLKVQDDKN